MASDPRTTAFAEVWRAKPSLRLVYGELFREIAAAMPGDPVLEIGGGAGLMKAGLAGRRLIATDILPAPGLDAVADAAALPFAAASFGGVVLFDVLHHLPRPLAFLAEAERVLRPGGRLTLCEPAITPASWPVYNFLHPEPVDFAVDPFDAERDATGREPFAGNQAIPTIMLARAEGQRRLAALLPGLKLVACRHLALFAYPLSGGYKRWSLLPAALAPALLDLERCLAPHIGRLFGFRLLAVFERQPVAG